MQPATINTTRMCALCISYEIRSDVDQQTVRDVNNRTMTESMPVEIKCQ